MRKNKLEILNETMEYYSVPGRLSYGADKCRYLDDKGNKCAVGRVLINNDVCKGFDDIEEICSIQNLNPKQEVFKEEYRGHSLEFWNHLQQLHDLHYPNKEAVLNEHTQYYTKIVDRIALDNYGDSEVSIKINQNIEVPSELLLIEKSDYLEKQIKELV